MKSKIQNLKSEMGTVKGLRTLRARIFWSLIPIILLLVISLGVIDYRQQKHLAEEAFIKKGEAVAENLVQSSRLAVFTENEFLLNAAMKGVTADADFSYVLIYGEDWKVLAKGEKAVAGLSWQFEELSELQKDRLQRQRKGLFEKIEGKKERLIEFLAPISSVDTEAPYELQVGSIGSGPGDTERPQQRAIGAVRLGLSLKNVDSRLAALLKWRGGLLVVFLLLTTLVIYVFSRRITHPIKQLTDQATRIADGYLDQVIPINSRDEIGQLAVTFNDMARSLKGNINEKELALTQLKELNVTLEDRIQQRTVQLQDATRHKSEFLANVNHEIRTPVSAIIASVRLVLRRTDGKIPPLERENLQGLLASAEHLLGLINGLLDLSKIEAGRMELRNEPIAVEEFIQGTLSSLEPTLKQEQVRLIRDIAPDLPILNTDREKLRQVILNLLGNAVKFTEKGEIKVTAARQNGSLKLAVTDTGIGIEKGEVNQIFEEFHQGEMSSNMNYDGTGLGLAITKKFVNLLGGEIDVDSEVGKGSTFTVVLPFASRKGMLKQKEEFAT